MLKNISSMNKKNDNELLEIPDFLKKLSTDEKDDVRPKIEQPDTTKITPLTEFKEEPKAIKSKPKVDIQAKIKEHTQNYFIDIREIIDMQTNNENVESVYDFCKENNVAGTYCGKLIDLIKELKHEPSVGLLARNIKLDERTE